MWLAGFGDLFYTQAVLRFVFLIAVFFLPLSARAQGCFTPSTPEAMTGEFLGFLKKLSDPFEIRIAVLPFQDASPSSPDPVLEKAFTVATTHYLSALPKTGAIHPILVFNAVDAAGLKGTDLFEETRVMPVASNLGATHIAYGMFQKNGNSLRFFVKIMDAKGNPVGVVTDFSAANSERLFASVGDAAQHIAQTVTGKKIPPAMLAANERNVPDLEAFRFYVKGMDKSRGYNEMDLEIAKAWFEKATQLGYGFGPAYEEAARATFMSALLGMSKGKDMSLVWGEGRRFYEAPALTANRPKKGAPASIAGKFLTCP